MPNIRAAMKSLRKDRKRHARNKSANTELRTLVKNTRNIIPKGDKEESLKALRLVESKLCRAAKSNIISKNNASRRISRLRKQFAKMSVK